VPSCYAQKERSMKSKSSIVVSTTICIFILTHCASEARTIFVAPPGVGNHQKTVVQENLDDIFRLYVAKLRYARSIDDLEDFLPVSRVRKFRNEFSSEQWIDWLRYRKQMPKVGKLVSLNIQRDTAQLLYETIEKLDRRSKVEVKNLAEITMIKEEGRWKIYLEHFRPSNAVRDKKSEK
jgi:phage terminase Nu1 subunit (DNA packaging protein)